MPRLPDATGGDFIGGTLVAALVGTFGWGMRKLTRYRREHMELMAAMSDHSKRLATVEATTARTDSAVTRIEGALSVLIRRNVVVDAQGASGREASNNEENP